MIYKTTEDIKRNLADAGCKADFISKFMSADSEEEKIKLLSAQRNRILDSVHTAEDRLSCMDYLIYQIKQKNITIVERGKAQ